MSLDLGPDLGDVCPHCGAPAAYEHLDGCPLKQQMPTPPLDPKGQRTANDAMKQALEFLVGPEHPHNFKQEQILIVLRHESDKLKRMLDGLNPIPPRDVMLNQIAEIRRIALMLDPQTGQK